MMSGISQNKISIERDLESALKRRDAIRGQRSASFVGGVVLAAATGAMSLVSEGGQVSVLALGMLCMLAFAVSLTRDTSKVCAEIAALEDTRNMLERLESLRPSFKGGADYIDQLGQSALSNLKAYFEFVMQKHRQGVVLTHGALIICFLLVVTGIVILYVSNGERLGAAILSAVSGIVTKVVSDLFFLLNRSDSEHLDKYQEKLERLNDIVLMLVLMESISSREKADEIRRAVVERICAVRFAETPFSTNQKL